MKTTMFSTALLLTAGLGAGLAQEQRTIEYRQIQTRTQTGPGQAGADVIMTATPGNFFFQSSEMAFDSAVVKGAPYSADATTETTQTLADGNRIHRTTKASLFRDSEGRTRREQTLGELGPLTTGEPIQTIVISDPIAGSTYMLNSREKIAHKLPGKGEMRVRIDEMAAKAKRDAEQGALQNRTGAIGAIAIAGGGGVANGQHFEFHTNGPMTAGERKAVNKESLGTQMIEGVAADGTRTTWTIPAGAMGNERPIDVVTETWYSNQLHTTVMTKTTDPRAGETIYTLKNIKLTEPDQSLFTVPADYTVQ